MRTTTEPAKALMLGESEDPLRFKRIAMADGTASGLGSHRQRLATGKKKELGDEWIAVDSDPLFGKSRRSAAPDADRRGGWLRQ